MLRIIILTILLLFSYNKNVNSQEKIVFIDLNYIFINSVAGKDLNTRVDDLSIELDNKIKLFKEKITLEKNKLMSQKNVLSPEEYNKKVKKLENDINEKNQSISKKKKELSIFKSKGEKEFFKKLNAIIENYSVDNSIGIILKKNDLLMAKKDLDITKYIFDLFNEKVNKITIN
ncbi:OmpH family outer membrane protein [Candidatus Pelagibacter sp.]|jgi:Skp family chaperone for outer membrane proteins|nr:OmpH family outer membrane protein [Candidatus Pelagibacter sp.]